MANYGVNFNGTGQVDIPAWTATGDYTEISIDFVTPATLATEGLLGNSGANSFIAIFANGSWQLKHDSTVNLNSASGVFVSSTHYTIVISRTGSTVNYTVTRVGVGVVHSGTTSTTNQISFTRIGDTQDLEFSGQINRVVLNRSGDSRDYYSSVNTGSTWSDIGGGAQDGTLNGLATDGSQWVLLSGSGTNVSATAQTISIATYTATVSGVSTGGTNLTSTTASISASTYQASVSQVYSITTEPLKNNTGTVLASTGAIIANVYNISTGALVVRKTGLTSDASGVVTFSDAALSGGTTYIVQLTIGTADGVARIATGA